MGVFPEEKQGKDTKEPVRSQAWPDWESKKHPGGPGRVWPYIDSGPRAPGASSDSLAVSLSPEPGAALPQQRERDSGPGLEQTSSSSLGLETPLSRAKQEHKGLRGEATSLHAPFIDNPTEPLCSLDREETGWNDSDALLCLKRPHYSPITSLGP